MGLGQIIKHDEIKVSDFDDFDFCSKVTYSCGDVYSFRMYRDPVKTLTTKQYYIKRN